MINWKSILSVFCDKPTLTQWLCKVEKALKESILEQIKPIQGTDKTTLILSFLFADGTTIETPEITLPRGPQGIQGPQGPQGASGVSITGIDTVGDEVVGDETLTTLRAHYSNNTTDEFVVTAKNGAGGGKLYIHTVLLKRENIDYGRVQIITSKKDKLIATEIAEQEYYFVLNYYRYDAPSNTNISVIGGHITKDHGELALFGNISINGVSGPSTDINAVISFSPVVNFDTFDPNHYTINEL